MRACAWCAATACSRSSPEWEPQKGQFGYARRLRWVFFDDGGYVAMCKRYRQHARQTGLLKTLAEKRIGNPNVDLLVGAVNVWCWDTDAVGICRELQAAGIGRILWSNAAEPETLRRLNAMGVLTSRYDIYQDVMDPANFSKLRWRPFRLDHRRVAQGSHARCPRAIGCGVGKCEGKDGRRYPCGVLCDRQAPAYARQRIPDELKTHPYRCRFIDTTTASPWRECYNKDHPMTRSESRHWKMDLLKYVSEDCQLVTGSETGHEAAVPYVHYFEGMLSLGPYRVPDAGRNMSRIWNEVPGAGGQVSDRAITIVCRCGNWSTTTAWWPNGTGATTTTSCPSSGTARDLFNALYGTPPMFMFNRSYGRRSASDLSASYRTRSARRPSYGLRGNAFPPMA